MLMFPCFPWLKSATVRYSLGKCKKLMLKNTHTTSPHRHSRNDTISLGGMGQEGGNAGSTYSLFLPFYGWAGSGGIGGDGGIGGKGGNAGSALIYSLGVCPIITNGLEFESGNPGEGGDGGPGGLPGTGKNIVGRAASGNPGQSVVDRNISGDAGRKAEEIMGP